MTRRKLVTTLLVALLSGSAAFGQIHQMERRDTSVVARSYNLNPVVVTGSGHHQRLKSTATPVHVLSSQEIREQGITTFDQALTRMLPQVSMAPNSMGTFLRLNGLGNKYILILINGQKLSGDISNNVDLNRISMSRVKRIEILDGAASSLYGSDAIGGVINIITDQPTSSLVSVTSDTRISGHGVLTQGVNVDVFKNGFGSYTTFTHDRADSYQNNTLEYKKGSDTETQETIAPYFTLLYGLPLEHHRTEVHLRSQPPAGTQCRTGLQLQDYGPSPHPSGHHGRHRLRDALQGLPLVSGRYL